jgi:taurine dioxygenase
VQGTKVAIGRTLIDIYPPWGPRDLRRLPPGQEPLPYPRFGLAPLGPTIGAEITGVDLARPLDADLRADVHRAFLEWKVLVFRGQELSPQALQDFAAQWGEVYDATLIPADRVVPAAGYCTGNQNYWHADDTYMATPGIGSVLRIAEVPSIGGDTLFADMAAAYDNLDDGLKAAIADLRAVHDCAPYAALTPHYRDRLDEITDRYPPVAHPVVRTHPETGRLTLFVNAMWTKRILGLDPEESDALLLHLCAQATVPEYQCRIHWSPDTVVFWDNRAVQHYAVSDYTEPRLMIRSTLRGDAPY